MSTTIAPEKLSGRHPVNIGHLVMGIAFLAIVGVWAVVQADMVDNDDIRWLLPVPWVLAGLGGLLAMAVSSRRKWSSSASTQVGWVEPAEEPDTASDVPEPDTREPGTREPDDTAHTDIADTDIADTGSTPDHPETPDQPDTPEESR